MTSATTVDTSSRALRLLPLLKTAVVTVVATAAGLLVANLAGYDTPPYVLLLGVVIGVSYGLLSVGMVLVFRTSRVINFAQAQIGTFAAALLPVLVSVTHLPFWAGFVLVALSGAAIAAIIEVGVVRRLATAPRVMVVAATLCVGALLAGRVQGLSDFVLSTTRDTHPEPTGLPEFRLGPLLVTPSYLTLMIVGPVLTAALALFLIRSRYGLALRAASANPAAARLAGISHVRMSALAWGIAGALAAITAVLLPTASGGTATGASAYGTDLLLRALAGALIARMRNIPHAMIAGILLGVLEQVVLWHDPRSDLTNVIIFVAVLIALLVQRGITGRGERPGSWNQVAKWTPLPRRVAELWSVRHLGKSVLVVGVLLATWYAMQRESQAIAMSLILAGVLVAMSASLLTSLLGELSLGQYAVAALGGGVSLVVVGQTGNIVLGMVIALATAVVATMLLGAPSLRVRGLMLTVTTLTFAIILPDFVLARSWLFGDGIDVNHPILGTVALVPGVPFYLTSLVLFAICLLLCWNVWRGGFGRKLVATRDNEFAARAFGLRTTRNRVQAFAVAGLVAGFGGITFVYGHDHLDAASIPADLSISVVLALVVGGLGGFGGPIAGAVWVFGFPVLMSGGALAQAAAYAGVLTVILISPGGILHLVRPVRDEVARLLARLHGVSVSRAELRHEHETGERIDAPAVADQARPQTMPVLVPREPAEDLPPGQPLLQVTDLTRHFGGIRAVDGISFEVRAGETVGLIGPNGAGKTTTFEMLSGFIRPSAGSIRYQGQDITRLAPERRVGLGLVRSFQDAQLFPTMCVLDVVMLSLERQRQTSTTLSVLGLDPSARARRRTAEDIVGYFGLGDYRGKLIRELSTGTRRIVELAALLSLQPRLLLLDEPSSGIAQRETEALGVLLRRITHEFAITVVLIEHDIPLVMSLSDRIIAIADGKILCDDQPDVVRRHPAVVDSYLGGSLEAIERSNQPTPTAGQPV